ncbi:MAG: hypothetical protein GQ570_11825 [Helicobacteraceae bacterium]|nr:hypothetical protein [Helicobacteraceae bacterium]
MANISDTMADLAITRSLILQRVSNGLSTEVASIYQEILNDINSTIKTADAITIRNANTAISELQSRINPDLDFMYKELDDLALAESAYAISSTNAVVGVEIFKKIPKDSTLLNIAKTSLMSDGNGGAATIPDWFEGIDQSMMKDLQSAIKLGVMTGESNHALANRVSNILGKNRVYSESVSRTSVAMVSNQAREAVYSENQDVIKGKEFVATIDFKTTKGCGARDGAFYDNENNPLNAKARANPYQPVPRHIRCRSVYTPILKSFKELGLDIDEVSEGTRSSLDGQISSDTSFTKWFEGKSLKQQEKYLGVSRFNMWKDGKITFNDLVNQRGEELSVKDLREKYS